MFGLVEFYASDLESDDGDLVTSGLSPGWEWGNPGAPVGAHSGQRVWGTVLAGDYEDDALWCLELQKVRVPKLNPRLTFWHWYDIEQDWDGANLKLTTDGGQNYDLLTPSDGYPSSSVGVFDQPGYSGSSGGWIQASFDLGPYAGRVVNIRFSFGSDGSVSGPGWYIDDVAIVGSLVSLHHFGLEELDKPSLQASMRFGP
jgi:bacillopeptidase F